MIYRKTASVVLILICGAVAASAAALVQDRVTVRAVVDNHTVRINELIEYRIEITGARPAEIATPDRPDTEGLTLIHAAPSTERSISIVNGVMTDRTAFVWRYRPVREGSARISGTTVVIDGEPFRTGSIEITVSAQPAGGITGRAAPSQRSRPDDRSEAVTDRDIFIRAVSDRQNVYQNEQLVVTYYLYVADALHIRNSRASGAWEADGFWREDLSLDDRQVPSREVIDGRAYNRIPIRRAAFFPTRSGSLRIDSFSIRTEAAVVYRGRDSFDSFFGRFRSAYEQTTVTAPAVNVQVRSLPQPAPEGFTGAVGSFEIQSRIDRSEVRAGQAVTLEYRVSGNGNVATVGSPSLQAPAGVSDFPPQVETTMDRNANRLAGSRTFKYAVVPRVPGTIELHAPAFTFFDPAAHQYRTVGGERHELLVLESGIAGPSEVPDFSHGEPAPIMQSAQWRAVLSSDSAFSLPVAAAAFGIPMAALAGLFLLRRRQLRLAADPAYHRYKAAHRAAARILGDARNKYAAGEVRGCYGCVSLALISFLEDRCGISSRGLTQPQLDSRLAERGIPEELRNRVCALFAECETAQYAPVQVTRPNAEATIARAGAVIDELNGATAGLQTAAAR